MPRGTGHSSDVTSGELGAAAADGTRSVRRRKEQPRWDRREQQLQKRPPEDNANCLSKVRQVYRRLKIPPEDIRLQPKDNIGFSPFLGSMFRLLSSAGHCTDGTICTPFLPLITHLSADSSTPAYIFSLFLYNPFMSFI